MQLYRGDHLVQPVRWYRTRFAENFQGWFVEVNDAAYGGIYQYDPAAFEPSQHLTLKVRKESDLEKWSTVEIDPKVQKQIWDQFEPYRRAVIAEQTTSHEQPQTL